MHRRLSAPLHGEPAHGNVSTFIKAKQATDQSPVQQRSISIRSSIVSTSYWHYAYEKKQLFSPQKGSFFEDVTDVTSSKSVPLSEVKEKPASLQVIGFFTFRNFEIQTWESYMREC